MAAPAAANAAATGFIVPKIQAAVMDLSFVKATPKLAAILGHPAGPFTIEFFSAIIVSSAGYKRSGAASYPLFPFLSVTLFTRAVHFWAPTAKWLISIANIADLARPVEKMSLAQQTALTATGIIWSRYATQITPVNYNLFAVNLFMAGTGIWHIGRIAKHRMETPAPLA